MVPHSFGIARTAAAACAAVAAVMTASFGCMDANPSLYCYHQLLQARSSSLQDRVYTNHFANKTVWIVGASSGIGEQLAYQISPYCKKLILSSRNGPELQRVANNCLLQKQEKQKTATKCNPMNNNIVTLPMDITRPPEHLEETIQQQLGPELLPLMDTTTNNANAIANITNPSRLDCVIFNAGQGHLSNVQETDADTTIRMFHVNTIPPIVLTQLLMKHGMLAPSSSSTAQQQQQQQPQKSQIVLTSSVGGRMGVPLSASYAASKHALHGYAASLQAECASWLRVDVLCPGSTATTFFQNQAAATDSSSSSSSSSSSDEQQQQQQQQQQPPSPLKMPVERCAALAMTHICRQSHSGSEAWIAQQPTLAACYLQQYLPGLWKLALTRSIGPKRVSLYEQGLDLYDPASWTGRN